MNEAQREAFERNWDSKVRGTLGAHGIRVESKTLGRRADAALWLVHVRLPSGAIATVEVPLAPGVKHYSDAALYTVIGTVLSKHGGE